MSTFDNWWVRQSINTSQELDYPDARHLAKRAYLAGHADGYKKREAVAAIDKLLATSPVEEAGEQLPVEESLDEIADYENDRLDSQERSYDRRGRL